MQKITKLFLGIALFLQAFSVMALEDEKELARASLNALKVNHFAKYIAAPFENDTNFGYGPYNNSQNILNFKPVIPFHLTPSYDLIIRTIVPLYERTATLNQQNVIDGHYINGWGDINPTFFISPARFKTVIWGLGPTISLPLSSNAKYIGTGKWSVGPELAVTVMPGNWMLGFLTNNLWSIAGDPHNPAVNQFLFQYLVSYVFDKGWYLSTNPAITANWKDPDNQQWIVPFGLGGGRAFHWGSQSVSLSTHAYYNAIRPTGVGPNWQLQVELEWLLLASKHNG